MSTCSLCASGVYRNIVPDHRPCPFFHLATSFQCASSHPFIFARLSLTTRGSGNARLCWPSLRPSQELSQVLDFFIKANLSCPLSSCSPDKFNVVSVVLVLSASLSEHAPSAPVFLSGLILHDVAPFCHCFVVAASLPVSSLSVMIFSWPHSTNMLLHLSCSLDLFHFGTVFFILLHQRQCTHLTFEVQCCEQHVYQQHQSQRFGNLIAALVSCLPPQLFRKTAVRCL